MGKKKNRGWSLEDEPLTELLVAGFRADLVDYVDCDDYDADKYWEIDRTLTEGIRDFLAAFPDDECYNSALDMPSPYRGRFLKPVITWLREERGLTFLSHRRPRYYVPVDEAT